MIKFLMWRGSAPPCPPLDLWCVRWPMTMINCNYWLFGYWEFKESIFALFAGYNKKTPFQAQTLPNQYIHCSSQTMPKLVFLLSTLLLLKVINGVLWTINPHGAQQRFVALWHFDTSSQENISIVISESLSWNIFLIFQVSQATGITGVITLPSRGLIQLFTAFTRPSWKYKQQEDRSTFFFNLASAAYGLFIDGMTHCIPQRVSKNVLSIWEQKLSLFLRAWVYVLCVLSGPVSYHIFFTWLHIYR